MTSLTSTATNSNINILQPFRQWFESMEVRDPKLARLLGKIIPARCLFERDVNRFDDSELAPKFSLQRRLG